MKRWNTGWIITSIVKRQIRLNQVYKKPPLDESGGEYVIEGVVPVVVIPADLVRAAHDQPSNRRL